MQTLTNDPVWTRAQGARKLQTVLGFISAVCFAIGLVSLFDGLWAQMRAGPNELSLLPGEYAGLSGPTALKNPITSDLHAVFTPEDAPLKFDLEGFFTGYWFGSGMWRGKVSAASSASPGTYELRISFRGAGAQNAQKYLFRIFPSQTKMREASLSFIKRIFNINPFILASITGILALATGVMTFIFGRNYALNLRKLGLVQIWANRDHDIWCLTPKELAPGPGNPRMILNKDGKLYAEARTGEWHKGKLHLTVMDGTAISSDCLVCLRHPGSHPPNQSK